MLPGPASRVETTLDGGVAAAYALHIEEEER
jgi:hypothetical protein